MTCWPGSALTALPATRRRWCRIDALLDKGPNARETGAVRIGGHSRKRIARTLGAAYAAGLLSEDTYVRRVDELLGSAVIQPSRLAGDLNLRRAPRGRAVSAAETIARSIARARELFYPELEREPETLLALDWSGSTGDVSIGRHHGCDVVFPEPGISRRHVQLRFRDGKWILQDLHSTNGTFINGVRVGRCEVRPGDQVSLGNKNLVID
jgi:hypothetical protein